MDPEPPSFLFLFLFANGTFLGAIGLFILLTLSALISGSEVAFFSLSATQLSDEGEDFLNKKTVVQLVKNHKKLLATILIANNFINIAIVLLFAHLSSIWFANLNYTLFGVISVRFLIDVIVVTFLILLFGEILPKVYATRNNTKFSGLMAKPLAFLLKMLHLFSSPMQLATNFIETRLGKAKTNLSIDKLSQALELTHKAETSKEEQKMLQGIVSFGNTDTKQVMQPRIDVFGLDIEEDYSSIIPKIVKSGYSRIPVYKESLDTIEGVLYVKDLLPHLDKKTFKFRFCIVRIV